MAQTMSAMALISIIAMEFNDEGLDSSSPAAMARGRFEKVRE